MYFTADLHIHSHYAKATSPNLNLETLYQWAKIKGVDVIGTGDFIHPAWFKELQEKLIPEGNGFFILKNPPVDLPYAVKSTGAEIRFCLTTEISCECFHNGKTRRIHNLVYAPDFETARKISEKISTFCNLEEDGRPIINIPSRDLLEIVLESSPYAYFIPAHIWTPWFSLLGSAYGYDSVAECFSDLTPNIFALETSLSADPAMCSKFAELDRFTLMSNSDAHSAENVGREVNRFNTEMNYFSMFDAIKSKNGFFGTYEYIPELGKYYNDGHRNCNISLASNNSDQIKNVCPACGKLMTIGTNTRSERLSDRSEQTVTQNFEYIIPLPEILSEIHGVKKSAKKVLSEYSKILCTLGTEFDILYNIPCEDIHKKNPILAKAISRLRNRQFKALPGYDGIYGKISFFDDGELKSLHEPQMSLF